MTDMGTDKVDWPFRVRRLPLKGTHDVTCQLRLAGELMRHRRALRRATVYLPEPGPMLTMMLLQFFHAFRPRRLVLSGVESLTPSERRVADLAAQGMSNRDIAQALFVTQRTVETHLTHAFQKLSIGSRDQLATALSG